MNRIGIVNRRTHQPTEIFSRGKPPSKYRRHLSRSRERGKLLQNRIILRPFQAAPRSVQAIILTKPMPEHELQTRIRYHDTDPMGFLHHANYLIYFEMGRTELLRATGGNYRQMEEAGTLIVVAKAECRYHKPARYDDLVTVRTVVSKVTHVKITHEYEMRRGDELLASATVTLAMIDRDGRIQRIPEWMRR